VDYTWTKILSCGIWISEDLGENWFQANTDIFPHLGVSHIVYSPENPNIVYAGTSGNQLSSYGIIKSTNGGYSWQLTNFTPSNFSHSFITEIIVNPENENDVIVSTNNGTYQTIDGGSQWSKISDLTFQDMHYSGINFGRIMAVSKFDDNAGFYYSPVYSGTWTRTLDFQSRSSKSRIGVSHADRNIVYLWEQHNEGGDYINKFYKSTDEGNSFSLLSTIPANELNSRGFGFASMAVDQWDPNVIFIGEVHLVRSLDGGMTWENNFQDDYSTMVHVDHWDAHFFNYNNDLFLATDGGIWATDDYGESWDSRNRGLEITQYYRISTAQTHPYIVLGCSQDNGSMIYDKGWTFILGGDGMDNAIDPTDENTIYYSIQNGSFVYSYDGGKTTGSSINRTITGQTGLFVTPLALDTKNPDNLYAGYDRVWKSSDKGQTWTDFNHPSLCDLGRSCITHLDISKSNPNVIYALAGGTGIFRSSDAGENWTKMNAPFTTGNWLEIDSHNHNRLWVTKTGQIFESNDGGNTWTDIKGDLPNNIVYTAIISDEDTNDHLYVGTRAAGLYFKDASMTNWIPYDMGLPKVEISDLEIVEDYKLLRAGTYGRGIWQTYTMDYKICDDSIHIENMIDDGVYQANAIISSDGIGTSGSEAIVVCH